MAGDGPTPGSGQDPAVPEPTAEQLELAIASVPGVAAAEVARSAEGRDRLRISLVPGEDPEAIAWSVAATLRERFGIALDPAAISARTVVDGRDDAIRVIRRIDPLPSPPDLDVLEGGDGVVDVEPDGTDVPGAAEGSERTDETTALGRAAELPDEGDAVRTAPATTGGAVLRRLRPAITALDVRPNGDDIEVTATLRLGGREASGQARGLRTRRGRWRAISEATIDALGPLSGERVRAHVDHVTILSFTELAHVSVSVTLLTDRGEETFLGAALIRDDPDRAVMRATLDAVNRRVEPLLDQPTLEIPAAG
jgi:hypothetical protein